MFVFYLQATAPAAEPLTLDGSMIRWLDESMLEIIVGWISIVFHGPHVLMISSIPRYRIFMQFLYYHRFHGYYRFPWI